MSLKFEDLLSNVNELNNIFDVFNIISKISFTKRRGLLHAGFISESVASHMYKLVFFCIVFNKEFDFNFNLYKCILMCIVHDLAEGYIGDIIPADNFDIFLKHKYELKIINKMFNCKFNQNSKFWNDFIDAYNEYCEQKTNESHFVKFFDKLDFLCELIKAINNIQSKDTLNILKTQKIYQRVLDELLNDKIFKNNLKYLKILELIMKNKNKFLYLPNNYLVT